MKDACFFYLLIIFFVSTDLVAQTGIYWLNTPTGIERMDADGTNRQTLISWEVSAAPQGITMDLEGEKLYWTDWIAKKVLRANFDGSNIEDLTIEGLSLPEGIALDVFNQKMYWVDSGTKKIQRANMDGTDQEDIVVYPAVNFDGIAVDAEAGKVYWTLWGAGSAVGKVNRANLDGTDIEELVAIPNGILKGLDLDIAAGKMYWTDCSHDKIQRANLNGTGKEDLITEELSTPNAVSLDLNNQKMYWTDSGLKQIRRANLDGSEVEIVADMMVESPQDLVVNFDVVNSISAKIEHSQIQVFPNPVSNLLTINLSETITQISIFDDLGKLQREVSTASKTLKVNISDLENGIYSLVVRRKKGTVIVRRFQVLR